MVENSVLKRRTLETAAKELCDLGFIIPQHKKGRHVFYRIPSAEIHAILNPATEPYAQNIAASTPMPQKDAGAHEFSPATRQDVIAKPQKTALTESDTKVSEPSNAPAESDAGKTSSPAPEEWTSEPTAAQQQLQKAMRTLAKVKTLPQRYSPEFVAAMMAEYSAVHP